MIQQSHRQHRQNNNNINNNNNNNGGSSSITIGNRRNKLPINKCQTRIDTPCKLVAVAKLLQTVPAAQAATLMSAPSISPINKIMMMNQCTPLTTNTPLDHEAPSETIISATNRSTSSHCAGQQETIDTRVNTKLMQRLTLFALSSNSNLSQQLSQTKEHNTKNDTHHYLNHSNHSLVSKMTKNNYSQQINNDNSEIKTTTILSSSTSSLVTKRKYSKQLLDTILFLLSLCFYIIYQSIANQTTASSFIKLTSANRIVIKPADRVVLTPGHELSLRCDVADYPQTQFRWYRVKQAAKNAEPQMDQPQEEELLPDDDRYVIHNNNIIIRSPTLNDVGDYYCRVWPADVIGIEKEKMVKVRVRPFIEEFKLATSTGRSAVLMEGERLVLFCNVMDDYSSNVDIQWFKSKFPDDETEMEEISNDGGRLKLESVNATSKSLTIDSVTKDDRSYYKCQAANGVTDNSKVIMIRVRDKLIALWPTIGIILELIILFGVIFIAENRKVEPDFDTSGRKIIQM